MGVGTGIALGIGLGVGLGTGVGAGAGTGGVGGVGGIAAIAAVFAAQGTLKRGGPGNGHFWWCPGSWFRSSLSQASKSRKVFVRSFQLV